jgi:hypothetical protein
MVWTIMDNVTNENDDLRVTSGDDDHFWIFDDNGNRFKVTVTKE